MSDEKSEPWGLNQVMAVAAVRHCVTVYGPTVHWCARWVLDNWNEFTPHTRLCIQHEVTKALGADELLGAGPGSDLDGKRRDLEMIRTLWMRKRAV